MNKKYQLTKEEKKIIKRRMIAAKERGQKIRSFYKRAYESPDIC